MVTKSAAATPTILNLQHTIQCATYNIHTMCNIRGSCVAGCRECDPAATCNLQHRVSDGRPEVAATNNTTLTTCMRYPTQHVARCAVASNPAVYGFYCTGAAGIETFRFRPHAECVTKAEYIADMLMIVSSSQDGAPSCRHVVLYAALDDNNQTPCVAV